MLLMHQLGRLNSLLMDDVQAFHDRVVETNESAFENFSNLGKVVFRDKKLPIN